MKNPTAHILGLCKQRGFVAAGIAPAQPSQWSKQMLAWLEAGKHGAMEYLSNDLELRFNPSHVFPGTKSFLVVADQYAPRGGSLPSRPHEDAPKGRVARYAQGRDYHEVMKRRLHSLADQLRIEIPGSGFRTCIDTVPIFERELAGLAGLGWQAKNTMIIHPKLGSYFLLGVVATTLDLTPLPDQWLPTDHCGTCTRCIEACPTNAITPYSVDASRCISYLTIEQRGEIDPAFHRAIGDWMYGCDICQEVCPHNTAREDESQVNIAYTPRTQYLDVLEVLSWTAPDRTLAFQSSPMKRANLAMIKRNAVIAAGNALRERERPELKTRIQAIADDQAEPELVRHTARSVLTSFFS